MYKNRQHPTEVECRLFCCPILLGRCRFCSFLKLLSYRHTAKVVPFICLDIILTFAGFAITSFVILFVGNEALEALLIMSVFGLFLFLLGVNDIYAVFCCNQKIEAIYCGYNSYPGRYGITSYAPVFEYVCNGTAYHEQTTLTVPYRLLRRMTEGNTYPIYIHSKHPGVCVLKRRIRFTTVIEFGFAIMFLVVAILWQQS